MSAFKANEAASEAALAVLADESRTLVVSDLVKLECVSIARRSSHDAQAEFCERVIADCELAPVTPSATAWAVDVYARHTIALVDLLHIAVAVDARADEFVTTEAPTKPFFTIGAPVSVRSIFEPA